MAQSENEDTNHQVVDDDDDFGDDDYDDDEELEEDEDLNSEDESQIHALIDDLEIRFRKLVSSKISDVEKFFDNPATLQLPMSYSATLTEAQEGSKWDSSPSLAHPNPLSESEERRKQFVAEGDHELVRPHPAEVQRSSCKARSSSSSRFTDIGTQTANGDVGGDGATSLSSASATFVPCASCRINSSVSKDEHEEVSASDQARLEIAHLRDMRDSLITQRRQWADKLKHGDDKNDDEMAIAESRVYELEEALEAVDSAIEFKNEVVLGQPRTKLTDSTMPGSNEALLVTRLESLNSFELQRLLCLYFAKVVELRSSSRKLEKHLEHAENSNDELSRRVAWERKNAKDNHSEYEARLRTILKSSNSGYPNAGLDSYVKRMEDKDAAARKKIHDLERSLTVLLVRHGYLVNGADYNVKQVVKMLGIEDQLPVTSHRAMGGGLGSAFAAQPHHSRAFEAGGGGGGGGGWERSTRYRFSGLNHRRNGRVLDDKELERVGIHKESRSGGRWENERERERDQDQYHHHHHHHRQLVTQSQHPEVRREKHRLIIQPAAAHSSAQTHHHGNTHHHQYSNPHSYQPPYGSKPHGYK